MASKSTNGAIFALKASCHLIAHKHHLSPALRPGKLGRRGVLKSFPLYFEKAKNSVVISAQTTCLPSSFSSVRQNPSLYQPVIGFEQHNFKGVPSTLRVYPAILAFPKIVELISEII